MGGVEVTGRYLITEALCADDAAACAEMGRPEAEETMRRYRNANHSHTCPVCGWCAAQFSRTKHTCELPTGAGCWFCVRLPFYPPWIPVKERRADLVNKNRLGR